jgi:hypothetical protein
LLSHQTILLVEALKTVQTTKWNAHSNSLSENTAFRAQLCNRDARGHLFLKANSFELLIKALEIGHIGSLEACLAAYAMDSHVLFEQLLSSEYIFQYNQTTHSHSLNRLCHLLQPSWTAAHLEL